MNDDEFSKSIFSEIERSNEKILLHTFRSFSNKELPTTHLRHLLNCIVGKLCGVRYYLRSLLTKQSRY